VIFGVGGRWMGSTTNSSSSTTGIDGVGAGPATLTRQSPPPQISAMAMMETVAPQHHYDNELHSRMCDVCMCGSPFVECDDIASHYCIIGKVHKSRGTTR
jgi:hypothetical protein